jgi:RHS repeat-associated protein
VDVIFPTSASVDYTYGDSDHKHAVTGISTGETYNYDANGNMTYRIEGGQTYNQTFDAENRLISVTVNSQTTQFVYDGDGNLVKKIKPDGTCTIYVGGVYEVEKVACGGATTHTRVYYPAGGAMRVDGTLYFVIKDHLGSASVVTDASGDIVDEQRYFPYGESRLAGDNMLTDRLFTGQREMAELGIYDYGARFYDPLLMRFIQPDTLIPDPTDPQMLNRYSYAGNSPLNYSDPSGYTRIDVINRLKRAYGKHLWQEGGASKYWNQTGKRWDFKPGDDSATTSNTKGTIKLVDITAPGITLGGVGAWLMWAWFGDPPSGTTTVPNASVTLASLTGGGGGGGGSLGDAGNNPLLLLALIFNAGFTQSQQQTLISLTQQTGLDFEGITFSIMEGAPQEYVASGSENNIAINQSSFFSMSQSQQLFVLREEFGHHLQKITEIATGTAAAVEEAAKNFAAGLGGIGGSEFMPAIFIIPSNWKYNPSIIT